MQPPDFRDLSHSAWLSMFGEIPFPSGPVPGNSSRPGTWSSENQ